MRYPTLSELKTLVIRTGVSVVDMDWHKLGPNQMTKLLACEIARDKRLKKRGVVAHPSQPYYRIIKDGVFSFKKVCVHV